MSSVFQFLVAERVVSAGVSAAFERYRADTTFQATVEARMLMQDRVSLATLAGPLPPDMSHRMTQSLLYDMRHRFRSALQQLRDIDLETATRSADHQPARETV